MAKPAEFAPKITALLVATERTKKPLTIADMAKKVGCSTQQVYKQVTQLGTKAKVVGQSPTGAYLYSYDPDGKEVPRAFQRRAVVNMRGDQDLAEAGGTAGGGRRKRRGKAVLQINDVLVVRGLRAVEGDGVQVELVDEKGQVHVLVVNE